MLSLTAEIASMLLLIYWVKQFSRRGRGGNLSTGRQASYTGFGATHDTTRGDWYTLMALRLLLTSWCDNRLVGLVVMASASRAEDPGFESRLHRDFSESSHTSDIKLALQWLPCQAPGVIGLALGLVGPVSVYYDWVRWKVWSATSISVWEHVKLSKADPSQRYTCMLLGR